MYTLDYLDLNNIPTVYKLKIFILLVFNLISCCTEVIY